MIRSIVLFLSLSLSLAALAPALAAPLPPPPKVAAKAWILIDADTGRVFKRGRMV